MAKWQTRRLEGPVGNHAGSTPAFCTMLAWRNLVDALGSEPGDVGSNPTASTKGAGVVPEQADVAQVV